MDVDASTVNRGREYRHAPALGLERERVHLVDAELIPRRIARVELDWVVSGNEFLRIALIPRAGHGASLRIEEVPFGRGTRRVGQLAGPTADTWRAHLDMLGDDVAWMWPARIFRTDRGCELALYR